MSAARVRQLSERQDRVEDAIRALAVYIAARRVVLSSEHLAGADAFLAAAARIPGPADG